MESSTKLSTPPALRSAGLCGRRALLAGLLGLSLAGCGRGDAAGEDRGRPASMRDGDTYVLTADGATARVTRTVSPDGAEVLHGETELTIGGRHRIVEDVRLDDRGRLASAEITMIAGDEGAPEARLRLDPATGVVALLTPTGASVERAPVDAPWAYTPSVDPGRSVATPVAAWVALRAAAASPWVRVILPERRQGWLTPRDQVAVQTEVGFTVMIGADGIDADEVFIERIRLSDPRITLVRAPGIERYVL
jgi:hypothetical protein